MTEFPENGSAVPSVLVISHNRSLIRLVQKTTGGNFEVVVRNGSTLDRDLLSRAKPKLVVFDDAAAEQSERVWMLRQIKRFAPDANVVYVAAEHTPELERHVRAVGVAYYGSFDRGQLYALAEKFRTQLGGAHGRPALLNTRRR
jgi:DNA-binding NarL/FixJ family response regulator